ncbi:MAG: SCO family protein [Methylococcales bacterium]|nr:SCO family protein [Methylococcaceae bacterium]
MKCKWLIGFVIAITTIGMVLANSDQITLSALKPTVSVPDAALLDQNGSPVRFVKDIAGSNIIAINFIYTDCQTVCPLASAIFAKLQHQLGNKLKQDIRLVTLSINPVTDSPEKLKAYADHFHAQPEWRWLTGEKVQVDALLKGLGVYNADYTNHSPVILVGDLARGEWSRFNGLTSPDTIAARIDELLAARHEKN